METFSALLALSAGISSVPDEFPSQRPVTRGFDAFFDLCLNKQLGKQSWCWWFETPSCSLWCHCNEINPYPLWEAPTNVSKLVISASPQHAERTLPATILIIYTANQNGYLYGRYSWLILLMSTELTDYRRSEENLIRHNEWIIHKPPVNANKHRVQAAGQGQQLVDDIFKGILLNENIWIAITVSCSQ